MILIHMTKITCGPSPVAPKDHLPDSETREEQEEEGYLELITAILNRM
jgi:hypothetical protein